MPVTPDPAQHIQGLDVTAGLGFWCSRRVLVTGHTGFKGAWLCHWLLRQGAVVSGFALGSPSQPNLFELTTLADRISHREGDVRDLRGLRRYIDEVDPQIVFHMAARSLVLDGYRDPVATFATNVMGTVNLLEVLRSAPSLQACIVVTSDKCYENAEARLPFREDDPMGGADPYSASKGSTELVTAAFQHSFYAEGGGVVASVRAGNVIGGGDWASDRLVPDIVRALTTGSVLELRHPDAIRPWQHVLDPLRGYTLLAEHLARDASLAGGWNFGPEPADDLTVRAFAAEFGVSWGAELEHDVQITPASFHEEAYIGLDSSKARFELGWQPRWDVRETLVRTIVWYRGFYLDGTTATALVDADLDAHSAAEPVPGRATA